ncbi:MAG: hypothetical protein ABW138_10390, partial [Candidatus Thiodiazotropha sp. 4PDIVS1]
GLLTLNESTLLPLKKRQSRREERGLVTPNERRATPNGAFSGVTRRAEAIFPPSGVIIRSCRMTTPCSFCLAGRKNSLSRVDSFSVNRP